ITRDDLAQRRVGDRQLLGGQTVLANLPRNQIPPGDLELLTLSVPREVDGLQAVEQWSRDALLEVRGRDEQDLRKVERHAQIVIGERVVLRRVEHLEERRRRIALKRHAELVQLVEQEYRV